MQTSPRLAADVTTTTPTAQKLALGVLILGALTLSASVVMGLITLPKKTPRRPAPLVPYSVSGVLYTRSPGVPSISTAVYLLRSGRELGWFPVGGGFTTGGYASDRSNPLALSVRQAWQSNPDDQENLPAMVLSLSYLDAAWTNTNDGGDFEQRVTLCLPEVSFDQGSGYTNSNTNTSAAKERTFYFDRDGTPYLDSGLRQRATTAACPQLLAAAYRPYDMTSASLNAFYQGVQLTFSRVQGTDLNYQLGVLNQRNQWSDGAAIPANEGSRAPLQVEVAVPADLQVVDPEIPPMLTLPSRVVTTVADGGRVTKLCLPEDTMRIQPTYETLVYYFSADGTPYSDSLLTQRMTNTNCPEILGRWLQLTTIERATASRSIDGSHGVHVFNHGRLVGMINGQTWTPVQPTEPSIFAPLSLVLGGGNGSDVIDVPDLTVALSYDGGSTRNLCFKGKSQATLFPVELAYFYDTAGQAYTDMLLQHPVSCGTSPRGTQEVAP